MDERLRNIPFVNVRIDDILVSGCNDDDHLQNLRKVLRVLRYSGLTLKVSKCSFMQSEVTYCGYVISKEGVRPMSSNVEAVSKAPAPTNVTELHSFLGMVNYYHAYLRQIATVTEPLNHLLRKEVKWLWNGECESAFVKIKEMLCKAPLLTHFDAAKPIVVHTDASPYGLSHIMSDGREQPP